MTMTVHRSRQVHADFSHADFRNDSVEAAFKNEQSFSGATLRTRGDMRVKLATCIVVLMMLSGLSACATNSVMNTAEKSVSSVDLFSLSVDAQLAYQESRWFDAVRLYQEIVHHVPKDATAWFRLANTYAQQGSYDRAIHAYEESLKYDVDQAKAWFNLSTAYVLHARSAMQRSRLLLASGDPGKQMIQQRMDTLDAVVLGSVDSAGVYETSR